MASTGNLTLTVIEVTFDENTQESQIIELMEIDDIQRFDVSADFEIHIGFKCFTVGGIQTTSLLDGYGGTYELGVLSEPLSYAVLPEINRALRGRKFTMEATAPLAPDTVCKVYIQIQRGQINK